MRSFCHYFQSYSNQYTDLSGVFFLINICRSGSQNSTDRNNLIISLKKNNSARFTEQKSTLISPSPPKKQYQEAQHEIQCYMRLCSNEMLLTPHTPKKLFSEMPELFICKKKILKKITSVFWACTEKITWSHYQLLSHFFLIFRNLNGLHRNICIINVQGILHIYKLLQMAYHFYNAATLGILTAFSKFYIISQIIETSRNIYWNYKFYKDVL